MNLNNILKNSGINLKLLQNIRQSELNINQNITEININTNLISNNLNLFTNSFNMLTNSLNNLSININNDNINYGISYSSITNIYNSLTNSFLNSLNSLSSSYKSLTSTFYTQFKFIQALSLYVYHDDHVSTTDIFPFPTTIETTREIKSISTLFYKFSGKIHSEWWKINNFVSFSYNSITFSSDNNLTFSMDTSGYNIHFVSNSLSFMTGNYYISFKKNTVRYLKNTIYLTTAKTYTHIFSDSYTIDSNNFLCDGPTKSRPEIRIDYEGSNTYPFVIRSNLFSKISLVLKDGRDIPFSIYNDVSNNTFKSCTIKLFYKNSWGTSTNLITTYITNHNICDTISFEWW